MTDKIQYLMSPELYEQLKFVRGFTDINGDSYMKHIVMILKEVLTDELKQLILKQTSDQDALAILKDHSISYTHATRCVAR